MSRAVKSVVALVALSYVGINVLMYVNQRDYMFYPSQERVAPRDVGLPAVEEIALQSRDGDELTSWFARPPAGQPVVLVLHGNAGAVQHRGYRVRELAEVGYGTFLVGYPGFGGNAGEPGEESLVAVAHKAYEYLRAEGYTASDIIIWGESIGTAVAVQLAAKVDARTLILEAPMSSVADVAKEHYPLLFARMFLKDKFLSTDYIDRINMPLLVMHGDKDRVIPIEMGRKLFEHASQPKSFVVLEGAGHNNLHLFQTTKIAQQHIYALP